MRQLDFTVQGHHYAQLAVRGYSFTVYGDSIWRYGGYKQFVEVGLLYFLCAYMYSLLFLWELLSGFSKCGEGFFAHYSGQDVYQAFLRKEKSYELYLNFSK